MSELIEPGVQQPPVIHDLATQKKAILESLITELGADVALLDSQLGQLSPQATLLFNSTAHPDIKDQVAKTAMGLMRLCASLDMDMTEAVESRILTQESMLFGQRDLEI